MTRLPKLWKSPWREQLGITGLETAIVLIAFVVVSSVFAFAALTTGLFTSDKAKETIQAGLAETQGTIEVKGGLRLNATLTAQANETVATADALGRKWTLGTIPVVPGSETLVSGDFTTTLILGTDYSIVYDTGAVTTFAALSALSGDYTSYVIDTFEVTVANAAGGRPVDLTPGETIAIYQDDDDFYTVTNFGLTQLGSGDGDNFLEAGEFFNISVNTTTGGLINGDLFTIQIKPPTGAVLNLSRRVPDEIEAVINLN